MPRFRSASLSTRATVASHRKGTPKFTPGPSTSKLPPIEETSALVPRKASEDSSPSSRSVSPPPRRPSQPALPKPDVSKMSPGEFAMYFYGTPKGPQRWNILSDYPTDEEEDGYETVAVDPSPSPPLCTPTPTLTRPSSPPQTPTPSRSKSRSRTMFESRASRRSSPSLDSILPCKSLSPIPNYDPMFHSIPIPPTIDDPLHELVEEEDEPVQAPPRANTPPPDMEADYELSDAQIIVDLAHEIIKCLMPTKSKKSVTATDRDLAIGNARQIIAMAERLYDPEQPTQPKGQKKSAKSTASSLNNEDLRSTIKSCIKEEIAALRKELVLPQPRKPSYAEMTRSQKPAPSVAKSVPPVNKPALIVAPKNTVTGPEETLKAWKSSVTFRDTNFAPAGVKVVSNNKLRVEFDTTEHRQAALEKINRPDSAVSAIVSKTLSPMIVLKGVSNETPADQLVSIIRRQNEAVSSAISSEKDMAFRFKRANRNSHLYNAVLLVSPAVFKVIVELGKVNVDHQRVHAENYIPLLHCFRCLGFGHTKARCKARTPVCSHCASAEHEFKACPFKTLPEKARCHNCCGYNTHHSLSLDTNHSATSGLCPQVVRMTDKIRSRTNYGV